jgi:hypothetical protein
LETVLVKVVFAELIQVFEPEGQLVVQPVIIPQFENTSFDLSHVQPIHR